MGKTKLYSLDGTRTKKSRGVMIITGRRAVALERKEGIVTAEGTAGDFWDAVNVLFLARVVNTGMLFYNNALCSIFM